MGTGKSTVTDYLKNKGHPCLDADELVKALYREEESKQFIAKINPLFISTGGEINFKQLRKFFFKDKAIKRAVESHIYQRLPHKFLQELAKLGKITLLFYDIPLLFEKKLEESFDLIATVYCGEDEQLQRVMARDRLSKDMAKKIIASQMDMEQKKRQSDYVLDNTRDTPHLYREIEKFLALAEECFFPHTKT